MSFDDELHYRRKRTTTGQSWLTSSQRKGTWWSCRWRGERTTTNESSYFKGFRFCMLWTDASSILSTHNFTKEEHKTLICTMRGKSQIAMLPNTPDKLDTFGSESSELISFSLVCLCSLQGVVCIGKISWSRITTSKEVAQENFLRLSVAKVTRAPWRFFYPSISWQYFEPRAESKSKWLCNMGSTAGLKKRLEG